ncbi:cytochrome c biogenesis protein CcdA [Geodermatophilus sp. TF02-6]|uniref:cytochrome c biogenesis CcdA family protein n=1 Tax=Geodermatophilus sp. TF02-6 TaxID=2250575 RepID=UPI000DEA16D6|nr:cytochrome c biogenesis protein CcdA [Geodermatophilus sp. TF02-6]RBY75030.1 cytochrome c biogenesis protein CcdA [Geodermatophilus sp. TF02-6]
MGQTLSGLVTDGPLLVAAAVAALVGLVSFASPCVLPLVPGYLSYVAGLAGTGERPRAAVPAGGATATAVRTDVDQRSPRGRMVLGAALFVLGFTAVFVAFGAAFGGLGRLLLEHADVLTRVLGAVTVVMGLAFLGWLPFLQRTARLSARPVAGLAGAPLLGVVFGLGWTPCLGPTLAAVNSLAYVEATAGRGALLGVAYCLGLGVPFVLVALGARWALGATSLLRRHARTVTRAGGALLVVVGVLLVTGAWTELTGWLRSWLATTGFGESAL